MLTLLLLKSTLRLGRAILLFLVILPIFDSISLKFIFLTLEGWKAKPILWDFTLDTQMLPNLYSLNWTSKTSIKFPLPTPSQSLMWMESFSFVGLALLLYLIIFSIFIHIFIALSSIWSYLKRWTVKSTLGNFELSIPKSEFYCSIYFEHQPDDLHGIPMYDSKLFFWLRFGCVT